MKFPAQAVDEAFLRKLADPFGRIMKVLMFPSLVSRRLSAVKLSAAGCSAGGDVLSIPQAFMELGSVDQARDLVKFHQNQPPTFNGEQMEFSMSHTFSFLQVLLLQVARPSVTLTLKAAPHKRTSVAMETTGCGSTGSTGCVWTGLSLCLVSPQSSRVISFSPTPSGESGLSDLMAVVERFGSPLYTLFLPSTVSPSVSDRERL